MNTLLLAFALCHLGLLAWTFTWRGGAALWLLRLLLLGMCWDNLVQGLGHVYIDTEGYAIASRGRYLMHAAILPLLTLFGLWVMRRAGVRAAQAPGFVLACWLVTLVALLYGLYHEAWLLELEPTANLGVEKLVSQSKTPPLATIGTNLVLLLMAATVWRASAWPWLFLCGLFIFLVNGATASLPWGFVAGNFAEIVFILGLLATQRRFEPLVEDSRS